MLGNQNLQGQNGPFCIKVARELEARSTARTNAVFSTMLFQKIHATGEDMHTVNLVFNTITRRIIHSLGMITLGLTVRIAA
jgi:hypothetical protein